MNANYKLTLMQNRINDILYSYQGVNPEIIAEMQSKINLIFQDIGKKNPYKIRLERVPVLIQKLLGKPEFDLNEFIGLLYLSIQDTLMILQAKQFQLSQILKGKRNYSAFRQSSLMKIDTRIKELQSYLITFQDDLLELKECKSEKELIKKIHYLFEDSE